MHKKILSGFVSHGQQLWILLKETYNQWSEDKASQLGAALAFYTIFSLAPILIIVVAVVGFVLGKESVQIYILAELTKVLGEANATYVMTTIQSSYQAGSGLHATIIALVIMLVGSTTVCVMLQDALNTMWGVDSSALGFLHYIKNRIFSF